MDINRLESLVGEFTDSNRDIVLEFWNHVPEVDGNMEKDYLTEAEIELLSWYEEWRKKGDDIYAASKEEHKGTAS